MLHVVCVLYDFYRRQVFSDDEEEEKRVVRSQKDKRSVWLVGIYWKFCTSGHAISILDRS